jgi:hypothetical protein
MRKLLLAASLFVLAGCASWFEQEPGALVEVGELDMVKGCELIATYEIPTGYRLGGTPYLGGAKAEAIDKAEKQGATHVLWREEPKEQGVGSIGYLSAYVCPPDHDARREFEKELEEEY